jgi:hypothetical protein
MDMKWAHSEKPEWFTDELINESSRVYQEFQLLSVA